MYVCNKNTYICIQLIKFDRDESIVNKYVTYTLCILCVYKGNVSKKEYFPVLKLKNIDNHKNYVYKSNINK